MSGFSYVGSGVHAMRRQRAGRAGDALAQSRSASVGAQMPRANKRGGASHKLTAADARAAKAVAADRRTPQATLVTAVGKLGDQPELRTLCGVAIAAGLVASNRRLVRAGIRMLFAHEVATLAKD